MLLLLSFYVLLYLLGFAVILGIIWMTKDIQNPFEDK